MTAAGATAAISATAPWFIVSGYGSSSTSTRWTGPSVRSSMRPASISPKCRSFTVATRHNSSPGGRGNVRTVMPASSCSVSGSSPSKRIARAPSWITTRSSATVVTSMRFGQRYGRLRRTGVGADHHRPLNRQDVRRSRSVGAACTGRGHSASTAATIAAASSAVGVGRITGTDRASGTLSRLRGAGDGPTVAS